jgi:cytokinin dehydrogenase
MDRLCQPLRRRVEGVVHSPDQIQADHLTNFGQIVRATPRFVVEPRSPGDVAEVVRFARENRLHVATRGAAHSQSHLAVSDGGILLSMGSMGRIVSLDPEGETVDVEPGVVWRDLVHHTLRFGLLPRVLTNNLGVTVGGTLSMAGVGVASFRYGTQGDNVAELDAVTGTGESFTCSPSLRPDLFWGVIAGLGQVGILTRARLELRRVRPMTRTYYLLYDDVRRFLEDARAAMDSGRWDHLESWASPCPQGTKPVAGRRQPFARWFYPFHLTVEYDAGSPPDDDALLAGLRPWERVYVHDAPILDFLERLVPVFELWKRGGTWEHTHPWMETVLPWESAPDFIEQSLRDLPPSLLVGGHVLLWPAKGSVSRSRLFMRPPGENVVGFGILPAIPPRHWAAVRPLLDDASRLSVLMGGKRYLSGWVDFSPAEWRAHFGERWDELVALKRSYDPSGILNPGFVRYEAPAPVGG